MSRILLIGCGTWGRLILRDLLAMGVQTIVADNDEQTLHSALSMGARATWTPTSGSHDCDGVIVATPASTHLAVIEQLDQCGSMAPIFCEKPLADNTAAADRLVQRGAPAVYVMHIWRYHPGVRKLKALFDAGLIGELTLVRSVRTNWTSPRTDVDALANMAPHDLSILQYLLGDIPEPRYASCEQLDGVIVSATAALQDEHGPPCIFEVSNRYGEKRREIRLHGTQGVLVMRDEQSGIIELISGSGFIVPDHTELYEYEKSSALMTELKAFIDYLGDADDRELCSVNAGADVVRVIDRIRLMGQGAAR